MVVGVPFVRWVVEFTRPIASIVYSNDSAPWLTEASRFVAFHSKVLVPSEVRFPFASMGAHTWGSLVDRGPHQEVVVVVAGAASTIDSTVRPSDDGGAFAGDSGQSRRGDR